MNIIKNGGADLASISRREFVRATAAFCAVTGLGTTLSRAAENSGFARLPVAVFSKIYQELKLNYAEAAELTREAGLDGIDCPVRAGGEVLPERVADDLPKYSAELRKQGSRIHLLTSGITSLSSPSAEQVLRVAKAEGVKFYRLGFYKPEPAKAPADQAKEIRARLKDLAQANRELGMCGLFQNHRGSFGADLSHMKQVLDGFDADQIGAAFDLGHAILVQEGQWKSGFESLKDHLRVAYVKDAKRGVGFVPFGQGEFPGTGYFGMLKQMGYNAPFSLHIEFDWSDKKRNETRGALLKALRESTATLRRWLKDA